MIDLRSRRRTGSDDVFAQPTLNAFMAQGRARWTEVRRQITELVQGDVAGHRGVRRRGRDDAPAGRAVADYVDFYASEYHATNLGRLFRPDSEPLMPNWKHLPVGYHGRVEHRHRVRHGRHPALRAAQDPGSGRPRLRAVPPPRHRGRDGLPRRCPDEAGGADQPGSVRGARVRGGLRERLVRPRHPGLGVRAARPVPRARASRRRFPRGSFRSTRSRRPASTPRRRIRSRCRTCAARRSGAWTSTWPSNGTDTSCRVRRMRRCTGRRRRCSHTSRSTAPPPHGRPVRVGHRLRTRRRISVARSSN